MTWKEVHLAVDPGFRRPSLADSGLRVNTSSSTVSTVSFYDTADHRLARWNVALMRRQGNHWAVEVEGGEPLTVQGDGEPPRDAVMLLAAYARGAPLQPVATVRVVTRRLTLEADDGSMVRFDDERIEPAGDNGTARVRMLTVGARAGARKPRSSLVQRLENAGAHVTDKVAGLRALVLDSPDPEVALPRLSPRATVDEAIRGALGASVIRLFRNDGEARLGRDPEAVHQARVATRRLRSDLRTFEPLLDAEWVSTLRAHLKALADQLGSVRDSDVLLERLVEAAARIDDAAASERVLDALRHERDDARRQLITTMESAGYFKLLDELVRAAAQPRLIASPDDPAATVLPPLARRTWRKLKRRVRRLPAQPSDDELHAIRIAAKRARYAAEAVAPAVGPDAARFADAVADLQTHLGDLHDAVVAAQWLRDHAGSDPHDSLVAGELIGVQLQCAAELRSSWSPVWRSASRKRLRAWMR